MNCKWKPTYYRGLTGLCIKWEKIMNEPTLSPINEYNKPAIDHFKHTLPFKVALGSL